MARHGSAAPRDRCDTWNGSDSWWTCFKHGKRIDLCGHPNPELLWRVDRWFTNYACISFFPCLFYNIYSWHPQISMTNLGTRVKILCQVFLVFLGSAALVCVSSNKLCDWCLLAVSDNFISTARRPHKQKMPKNHARWLTGARNL